MYFCTDINWGGNCDDFSFSDGVCVNFEEGDSWNDEISSFGPGKDVTCIMYLYVDYSFHSVVDSAFIYYNYVAFADSHSDTGCDGYNLQVTYPGVANLVDLDFNDQLSSFSCFKARSK